MITISLCMIVKNEEETLARCLESVKDIVDEIIIIDTGSTDKTKEVAGAFTDKVIDFTWIDDFSAARNFSFQHATKEYILWLDADDVFLPKDRQKFLHLKQLLSPTVDGVSMKYDVAFDEHANVTLSVRRFRLVKREKNYQWHGVVHEDLAFNGNYFDSDIIVTHKQEHGPTDRNVSIYEKLVGKCVELSPRDTFNFARELHHHKAIQYYLKYMDIGTLSKEDHIFVYSKLADCCYYAGKREQEWEYMCKTFQYDLPRPEICCRLGYWFLEKSNYKQAIYWYKTALEVPMPGNHWAIVNEPSRTWLPHIQLALCYFQLGEYELSYRHNKLASTYRPNDDSIQKNITVLEGLLHQSDRRPDKVQGESC